MWLFRRKKEVSDEELVQIYFASGDKSLMGRLFEKHVTTVYGVCLYYFRDREQSKDAVMQIFEKMMQELRKTEIKNFKAWLGFVVRNYCISELRKQKTRRFVPESYLDFEVSEASLEEEEKIASVDEEKMIGYMKDVLPRLKDKQRICIELFYLQNLSYQDIAGKTNYTVNEVKSYIQNGKRNLKLLIEERIRNNKNAA
jgi:RNA polymerase sigma factor (sigma-70 family)